MIIRELLTRFGLNFDKGSFDRADSAVTMLKGAAIKLAGAIAVVKIASELKEIVTSTIDLADETTKAAGRLGLTSQALQELRFAGDLAGVSSADLDRNLARLSRTAGDAALGNEEAQKTFADLGIKFRDAGGKVKTADKLLESVADRIQKAGSAAERNQIAFQAFGKGGERLGFLLKDGAKGIQAAREELHALGGVIPDEFQANAEEFNDNLTRMQAFVTGLKVTFVNELLPALLDMSAGFVRWAKENKTLIKTKITEYVGGFVATVKALAPPMLKALGVVVKLGAAFAKLAGETNAVKNLLLAVAVVLGGVFLAEVGAAISAALAFAAAFNVWGAAALFAKIQTIAAATVAAAEFAVLGGAVLLALGAIFLLADAIVGVFTDADSIVSEFAGKWSELVHSLEEAEIPEDEWWPISLFRALLVAVATVFGVIDQVFAFIGESLTAVGDAWDDLNQTIDLFFGTLGGRARKAIRAVVDGFVEGFAEIPAMLTGLLDKHPLLKKIFGTVVVGASAVAGPVGQGIMQGASLLGGAAGVPSLLGPSPAAQAAGAAPSVSVNMPISVDASGQALNEAAVSALIAREVGPAVNNAMSTSNRETLRALTPQAVTP